MGPVRYGRVRLRARAWIVLLTVTACTLVAPAGALAVGWGINMDGNVVPGAAPAFTYQSNPYFTALFGGASCAQPTSTGICYAKLYIAVGRGERRQGKLHGRDLPEVAGRSGYSGGHVRR